MPKFSAVALTEFGHLAPIAYIESTNPRQAWYDIHCNMIFRKRTRRLAFWREGGYLIEDADGAIHQPIKPRK